MEENAIPTDDTAEKFAEILEALGSQSDYSVRVFRLNPKSGREEIVATFNRLPDLEEIGRMYGGGEYRLLVTWRLQGVLTGRPNKREVRFALSDAYTTEDTQARLRGSAGGTVRVQDDAGQASRILDAAERLAKLGGERDRGPDLSGVLERMFDGIRQMQQASDERFARILETLAASKPEPVNPMQAWKESMMFAKEMGLPTLGAEPESKPWVEIAQLVGDNLGKFLELMAAAQNSRAAQIRAMANPTVRRVVAVGKPALADPAKRREMISALDAKIGAENTEKILAGLGVAREGGPTA